jgi:hypothetical protein
MLDPQFLLKGEVTGFMYGHMSVRKWVIKDQQRYTEAETTGNGP